MRFAGMALNAGNYTAASKQSGGMIDAINAKNSPDYSGLANLTGDTKSQERIANMNAMAEVKNAGINSLANTQASAFGAQATIAAGEAAASATQAAGLSSMVGGLTGGLTSAFGSSSGVGGKWKDASSIGFKGNQVNDLGRIRY